MHEKRSCPKCNKSLNLDYWDIVWEMEDGSFLMDVFDAWVCEDRCGYYERAKEEELNGDD